MPGNRTYNEYFWGVVVLVAATLTLVSVMPAWRWIWNPEPFAETYPVTVESFLTRMDAMVARHGTGELLENTPVVHPPPGDIFLCAQRFRFFPMLELEVGHTYRLHVTTIDVVHGVYFPLTERNLLLLPGYAVVMTLKPVAAGHYVMQCSEYCGLDHSRMKGWVLVR
ncbi:Heme/copper-type cytochrome/quinol oxidase, subunit 2 [invertebrate metagenome]|uniref:Heme/copper-type cytochrome/quinol oxidase, subunit 2 n=1 Tax=invertebrate metagenome TaxID=1711999 RepID=A0A484H4I1_9ZZZZ